MATASHAQPVLDARASIDRAYDFLRWQMDRHHTQMKLGADPEFASYYPTGKTGDIAAVEIGSADSPNPVSGNEGVRLRFLPHKATVGWAGVVFQYPEHNWGERRGRDLTGATKITFWARADQPMDVEFRVGAARSGAFRDSLPPIDRRVTLNEQWRQFTISLVDAAPRGQSSPRPDLSSILGVLSVTVNFAANRHSATIDISDVSADISLLHQPRFLQSYVADGCRLGAPRNIAHVYDQALALLAFLARGTDDDLYRAELIARAMVMAQDKDRTFKDGRLRNAYASGELIDPDCGCTRLPGEVAGDRKTFLEDEMAAGTDTGNMSWAAIALLQLHRRLGDKSDGRYLAAAQRLAQWIVTHTRVDDGLGGFSGGYESHERARGNPAGQARVDWRSTEHNIDAYAMFRHLAAVIAGRSTSERDYWLSQAQHARSFVERMRSAPSEPWHLWTGIQPGGTTINRSPIPVDIQAWAVLGMGVPAAFAPALDWAGTQCRAGNVPDAFDFNCRDGDGAWWEGTAQMAAGFSALGRMREADLLLHSLRQAQSTTGKTAGALPAASKCGLTTGFSKIWPSTGETKPWLFTSSLHIGATAWYLFAAQNKNPYYLVPAND
ncbi:MAG: hypothetical protein JO055_06865 [Alphaproteobacteria bacterium]|nr:hypothetical protein [Alphaproteobacteria bacterium]